MYGAVPYLMTAFSLDRDSAFRIVCDWVDEQATIKRGGEACLTRLERATQASPPRRKAG